MISNDSYVEMNKLVGQFFLDNAQELIILEMTDFYSYTFTIKARRIKQNERTKSQLILDEFVDADIPHEMWKMLDEMDVKSTHFKRE